jgi:alpha-tubulin suppressor-like RCC1 family protein
MYSFLASYSEAAGGKIAAGTDHFVFITSDGVYSCGNGKYGKLGNQVESSAVTQIPVKVAFPEDVDCPIKQVSVGTKNTGFLTDSGQVYVCGSGKSVGRGRNVIRPKRVRLPERIRQIDCWTSGILYLGDSGNVYASGDFCQLEGDVIRRGKDYKYPYEDIDTLIRLSFPTTDPIKQVSIGGFDNIFSSPILVRLTLLMHICEHSETSETWDGSL